MRFAEHYAFRDALVAALARDLVGPDDPHNTEVIFDRPITKYAAGILFPQTPEPVGDQAAPDNDVEGFNPSADTAPDPAVSMANIRYPASMGLTFAVDTTISATITVRVKAARYVAQVTSEGSRKRRTEGIEERWQRQPSEIDPQAVEVTKPGQQRLLLVDGLEIFVRVRRRPNEDIATVTVVLINTLLSSGTDRDASAFFQTGITVTGADGTEPFVERPALYLPDDDDELRSYRLLFAHAPAFATGHGCSVEWDQTPNPINATTVARRTNQIRTSFVPTHDLHLADSNPDIDTSRLGMLHLATATAAEVRTALSGLAAGYRHWITQRRRQSDDLAAPLRQTAVDHLQLCDDACDRIEAGIAALDDPEVMYAFQLANHAMAMQRARTEWLKQPDRDVREPDDAVGTWRPFQLAFILLSIRGIADPASEQPAVADVLWFPTGGGKTEAYLGLIAFTTFLRRRRNPANGAGVTVLMRYTLRLLTVQQFERAALLICCMEALRRRENRLGATEISIGMWVGQDTTPNTLDRNNFRRPGAKQVLQRLLKNETVEKSNPIQIRSCPWCGTALGPRNYRVTPDRLIIACGVTSCVFHDALPVHLIDETIYRARPTLIIATADKFAGIPWKAEIAALFNKTSTESAPELIIQDELHLISGPLGTLAGLYETAIDIAADHPKVIASTATIRRANRQGNALFDRTVRQFPPPGIDSRDSYFSVEAGPADKPTRLYVGLMAPASSQTSLLVRAYAALLHHSLAIDGPDRVRDTYWTLLGYFNSLRLLAGAKLQVQDDVTDRLGLLAATNNEPERRISRDIELTSREPSSRIPDHLQAMAVSLPGEAIDVILATNMVSVGVDVDRLGLMVVMGQPQSTSEYIQATSRVGRAWPGLVTTLFNAARSRDRSHYEDFTAYHSALYRQVEATSVTPFSARARDRALHAAVIGLARLMIPTARPNDAAARITVFETELRDLCNVVLDRVERVAGTVEKAATAQQIDEIISGWLQRASDEPSLVYSDPNEPGAGLLIDAGRYDAADDEIADTLATLWSLRDVDVESKLYLNRGTK